MSEEAEIAVLRQKVDTLEAREREYEHKVKLLETRLLTIENSMRVGKGILVGFTFTLGSIGLIVFDRVREVLMKWLA